jgi:hypothetical protein
LIVFFFAHVIVAPILLPLNAVSPATAEPFIQTAAANAPAGPELAEQDLIIVNPPNAFFGHYFSTARVVNNQVAPRHVRVLAPGAAAMHVLRSDERTLIVRPDGGFLAFPFDNVFRGNGHPLRLGDTVLLTNMTAQVTALTQDGRPAETTFRFAERLEYNTFKWLVWKEGKYEAFRLPALGQDVSLPAQPLF